uniref:Uncharacterized protein n=1 Tax=Kuenenia stuttgartiensis TaxID=174633 RepID=Q1Q0Q9_KUEST|nr:unknown protein [Candidatus Kuenenia stuttgartiensis]
MLIVFIMWHQESNLQSRIEVGAFPIFLQKKQSVGVNSNVETGFKPVFYRLKMAETTLSGLIKQDVCDTIPVNQQACANIYKKSGMHP